MTPPIATVQGAIKPRHDTVEGTDVYVLLGLTSLRTTMTSATVVPEPQRYAPSLHALLRRRQSDTRIAGNSYWWRTVDHGQEYVVKQFLAPVLPAADRHSRVADETRVRCRHFFDRVMEVDRLLASCTTKDLLSRTEAFGVVDRHFFRVVRYVEGTLLSEVTVGDMHCSEAIYAAHAMAEGLSVLHGTGLVHGDLARNIILPSAANLPRAVILDIDNCWRPGEHEPRQAGVHADPTFSAPEAQRGDWERQLTYIR